MPLVNLRPLPSIISDNGKGFVWHRWIPERLSISFFFASPATPGSAARTNMQTGRSGMKSTDFQLRAQDALNNRPRRVPGCGCRSGDGGHQPLLGWILMFPMGRKPTEPAYGSVRPSNELFTIS